MAWIYFQELADYHSHSNPGSEQSPIVKSIDTARASYCHECDQVTLSELLSGMTCEHSKQNCYPKSTSSMAVSPAKTLALPALVQAWQDSEAVYISKSKGLSEKQNQLSCSLKTSLQLGHADLVVWCGDYPNWGMTVDGQLYLPLQLAPITKGTVGSCWPTPRANDSEKRGNFNLADPRNGLAAAAKLWPTPCARDYRSGMSAENLEKRKAHPRGVNLAEQMQRTEGIGQLNPTWVEWLMGYPAEWTVLGDLETQWFRSKPEKRSSALRGSRKEGVSA